VYLFLQGFRTTKTHRFDEQRLTLRIHRGRSSLHAPGGGTTGGSSSGGSAKRLERSNTHDQIQISVSVPPPESTSAYAVHYAPANGEGSAAAGLLGPRNATPAQQVSPSSCDSEDNNRPRFVSKMGKRNIKAQVNIPTIVKICNHLAGEIFALPAAG